MARFAVLDKLKVGGSAHTRDSVGVSAVDKSQLRNVYVAFLFAISLAILVFGLIIVYSSVQNNEEYNFARQLVGVLIGVVLMLVFWR